ncbi:restriction endonuclease [Nostoc sp.]|uniref:restriction endonuclease n=1 Tax=Nostoc sp. TaxID=1180 RepID=UPI002FFCD552
MYGYYGDELRDEFEELIQNTGFYFENHGGGVFTFWVDSNEELEEAYRDYFEWQWICDLVKPDFSDLYEEVYAWFCKHPDALYNLEPRQFEILLDGIFRNNGYKTQLGSGQADGGVDIRLYLTNEVIGEVVTLVQAKRYAARNSIKLEAVQALSANVEDERANKGLFVTTSRYLPCVQKFAARQNRRLQLATSEDVRLWSSDAAERIIRDKSCLIKPDYVRTLLNTTNSPDVLEGKIFHANTGYTMTINSFAMVLRESKGAALLMKLPTTKVSGDSFQGLQVPDVGSAALKNLSAEHVFRAKKKYHNNGELYFWGNRNLYSFWNGTPQAYDYLD